MLFDVSLFIREIFTWIYLRVRINPKQAPTRSTVSMKPRILTHTLLKKLTPIFSQIISLGSAAGKIFNFFPYKILPTNFYLSISTL
jgi:hypothetical protein